MKERVLVKEILRLFWSELRQIKLQFAVLVVGAVIGNSVSAYIPVLYRRFFDIVSVTTPASGGMSALLAVLEWILVLNILRWGAFRATDFFLAWMEARVMTRLRARSFEYILSHSYSFFINTFVGSVVQKLNRLPRAFERFFDRFVWDILAMVVQLTGMGIVLFSISPVIAFAMIGWVVLFVGASIAVSVWKLRYDVVRSQRDSETTAVLADTLSSQQNVQAFSRFSFESKRFWGVVDNLKKSMLDSWYAGGAINTVQSFLFVCAEFLIFVFALRLWNEGTFSVGFFVLLQAYFLQLLGKLWDFGRIVRDLYESFADATEAVELLEQEHGIQDIPTAKPLRVSKGDILFERVSFAFQKTRFVLRDLTIHIKPQERVALVGHSGSGKTTISKLLLRLYDPTDGKIMIDGQDIAKVTQESLRLSIAFVPQEPLLFHRSLKENIRYGNLEATDAEVENVARLAYCEEFIKGLPQGLETLVGERGIKLSGGERQRIAIARAFLKNAPIVLFDEATSSLDSKSEGFVQRALDALSQRKTVIMIAHRLSTIRKADRILVISNGRVAEEGSHDDLVEQQDGIYRQLWSLQAQGFEPEE